jgi:uncharacterized Zn finger protein
MSGLAYSEVDILRLAGDTIFQRGQSYYRRQAVLGMVQRGSVLQAEVEGSDVEPYAVSITLGAGGIEAVTCSCPFEYGATCKHGVAVLLAALQHPEWIEQRAPLATALAELDREQLRTLLLDVAAQHPDIANLVEQRIVGLNPQPAAPAAPPPDVKQLLSQIKALLQPAPRSRRYADYRDDSGGGYDELQRLAEQARPYLEAGDGGSAALVLEPITAAYVEQVTQIDYGYYDEYADEQSGALVEELGRLWAEALLSPNVGPAERKKWAKKLQKWQDQLDEYGQDATLGVAIVAATEGWETAEIRHILAHGTLQNPAAPDDDWYVDELAQVRLSVLERQQRSAEYLNLARALGQHRHYATMLVRLGRYQEAVAYGTQTFSRPDQARHLAEALWEHGQRDAARQIAAHGLTLEGASDDNDDDDNDYDDDDGYAYGFGQLQVERTRLARTLRDWAVSAGDRDQALAAALTVLETMPALPDYRAIQQIAGAGWPDIQPTALQTIRRARGSGNAVAKVEIFLHEDLIDDAIAIADAQYSGSAIIELVAAAAIATRPGWVIEKCRQQANEIMDAGRSADYFRAIEWLRQVKAACLAANRQADWQLLIGQLLVTHKRKYKLVPMLEELKKR